MKFLATPVAVALTLVAATACVQSLGALPSAAAWATLASVGCGAVAVAAAVRSARATVSSLLVLVAVATIGAALAGARAVERLERRLPAALEGTTLDVVGVVDELPVAIERGVRFVVRVESCGRMTDAPSEPDEADAESGPESARVATPGPSTDDGTAPRSPGCSRLARVSLAWRMGARGRDDGVLPIVRPGQRWALQVRLRRPHAAVNFAAFDRELRWLQEDIGAIGSVRAGRLLAEFDGRPGTGIERLRLRVRDAVFDATGVSRAREAGVLAALAIGDQGAIDPRWWSVFNQTGVGHLMSISGLHVTMLAGLAGAFAGRLWRTRAAIARGSCALVAVQRVRLAVAAVVGVGYALLAGWGIPAQRTCLMLGCAAMLVVLGRTASIAAAVAVAALVVVVLDPWAPLAAGFWLSFGAVVAIVWACAGCRHDQAGVARALHAAVRTQWAATIALLPLGAWFFASFSVVGPLANAVAIPLVSAVVTPLALAGGAVALLSEPLGSVLLVPAAWLVGVLLVGLQWLADLPGASVAVPRPGPALLAMTLAAIVLLLSPHGVPRRWLGLAGLLPLVAMPLHRPGPGALWVTALDVGQGMAVVVQVEAGVLVYDTGPRTGPAADAGARVLVPWLRSEGVRRLDAVVVSHQDLDHAGGAASLLAAMPPDRFASSLPDGHPLVRAAPRAERCIRGHGWRWGDARFDWLHPADPPEPARGSPTNALSCVLRVRTAAGAVLLGGDIGVVQERRLLEVYGVDGLRADVLVVPHHGSRSSSGEAFVAAVSPRWAIVQAGFRNAFRHPHPAVVERYRKHGAQVLRSDAHGAIAVRLSPGVAPQVLTARQQPARYWRIDVGDAPAAVTAPSSRRPSPTRRRAPGRPPASTGTPRAPRAARASRTRATAASRRAATAVPRRATCRVR